MTPQQPHSPGIHEVQPLSFDPAQLAGISERMIVSHHEHNYGGAVRNLNKVEQQLAQLGPDAPPFLVAGLRERELTFANSMVLHELYFGNLGADGHGGGAIQKALAARWGSPERWEQELRALGAGLAGGSGWAILGYSLHTGTLGNWWSGHHTQTFAAGLPLLVMDMYEHAYQMDYGAAAGKYVDAFFKNLRWEEVERRYQKALRAGEAARG